MIDIAICISTRNRKDAYYKSYGEFFKYYPPYSRLIVVDDASDPRYAHEYDHYFNERAGIPRVKNKCLQLAMEVGAKHIFLFDDDCYPLCNDWHLHYINSPYPHLCFTWPHKYQDQAGKQYWQENGHTFYTLGNGCMMYFTRECIDRVGGFRTEYGMGSYEHVDLSHRIHRAGIIPHPFIDVTDSDKLLYSMDANNEVERTFTAQEKAKLIQRNYPIFAQNRFNTNFVPYETIP